MRATLTASWYRQLGHDEVYAVAGGVGAWAAAGLDLETGAPAEPALGLEEASEGLEILTCEELATNSFGSMMSELGSVLSEMVQELDDNEVGPDFLELEDMGDAAVVLFVDTSAEFAAGHVPGARWAPRGWLELQVGGLVPSPDTPIVVTCRDGRNSALAAATLKGMGYANVAALEGGMNSWLAEDMPVETGLSGVMSPPTDLVASGPDRNYADMMNYLRWETALGEKYAG